MTSKDWKNIARCVALRRWLMIRATKYPPGWWERYNRERYSYLCARSMSRKIGKREKIR